MGPIQKQIHAYYAFWRGLNLLYERWAKAHGMSVYTLYTLSALWEEAPCTQKQICEAWQMPKQTVSTILKTFDQAGYLAFQTQQSDHRNKLIFLTESGKTYADGIVSELRRLEEAVCVRMGAQDGGEMMRCNATFLAIFQEEMHRRGLC